MSKTDIVVRGVSEVVQRKMMKWKEDEGYGEKDWGEFFTHLVQDVHLQDSPAELIQKNTRNGLLGVWVRNLASNLPRIEKGHTITDLVPPEANELEAQGLDPNVPVPGKTAIVIGKGPSLRKNDHLRVLRESGYHGTLMVTDGALVEALDAGIEPPNYDSFIVMTVDGNHEKIWKWYNDPLVDKYGKSIKTALCTTAAPNVAERCEKAGVEVYWFHPIFDNWRNLESYTKIEQLITTSERHPNGCPAMQAGGNAGSAAWVLSWLVLRRNPVALVGMDMGYLPEDDLSKTYYWEDMFRATHNNVAITQAQYMKVYNPDTHTEGVVDPMFQHYREAFMSMVVTAPPWLQTVNCTGGGVLFGEGMVTMDFEQFLKEHQA